MQTPQRLSESAARQLAREHGYFLAKKSFDDTNKGYEATNIVRYARAADIAVRQAIADGAVVNYRTLNGLFADVPREMRDELQAEIVGTFADAGVPVPSEVPWHLVHVRTEAMPDGGCIMTTRDHLLDGHCLVVIANEARYLADVVPPGTVH